jgi:hypothetical protein
MKKIFVLLAVFLFVASMASAATETAGAGKAAKAKKIVKVKKVVKKVVSTEESKPGHFFIQAQGGPGFILSDMGMLSEDDADPSLASPGWGYNVEAGYAFSDVVSLSLLYGYEFVMWHFDDPPEDMDMGFYSNPVMLVGKFTVPGDQVRFYGFLGVGLAFNSMMTHAWAADEPVDGVTAHMRTGFETINFEMAPGVGLELSVSDQINLFIQTKLVMNFISQDLADMAEGPEHTLTVPMMYLPLQVGMNFAL